MGGSYVKMVHNGIEYGDMQMICRPVIPSGIARSQSNGNWCNFWNVEPRPLGFLDEITADILQQMDPKTERSSIPSSIPRDKRVRQMDFVNALDMGVPAGQLQAAARCLSALKEERVKAELF